ncbi:MAG: membrane integrity-associated transporter subunit PqiC [Tatlockia sp.]|nr:membrane integrity-associated transporter subunit PqiC [Tatlockia sp.]
MKIYLVGFVLSIILLLGSCGRSPDSQFYVLNPIAPQHEKIQSNTHLRIGINEIHGPAYLNKPQLTIHCSAQEVKLEEYHRWVENLSQNTQNVIEANLATLLPGAALVTAPWDINFKPRYQLQIDIIQFAVDFRGNSRLRAEYLIYSNEKVKMKGLLSYHLKISQPNVANMVASMNTNLNQMTRDLAKVLARLK